MTTMKILRMMLRIKTTMRSQAKKRKMKRMTMMILLRMTKMIAIKRKKEITNNHLLNLKMLKNRHLQQHQRQRSQ